MNLHLELLIQSSIVMNTLGHLCFQLIYLIQLIPYLINKPSVQVFVTLNKDIFIQTI